MEIKNKSFSAPSRMERATKLFTCILVCLLGIFFNSNVFALTKQNIIDIFNYYDKPIPDSSVINTILDTSKEYSYTSIYYIINIASNDGFQFYFTNEQPKKTSSTSWTIADRNGKKIFFNRDGSYRSISNSVSVSVSNNSNTFLYFENGAEGVEPGWSNVEGIINNYKKPIFDFSLNYKGETTIGDNEQKIGAYDYTYLNTGITTVGKKYLILGNLYIDDSYIISNLLTSTPVMTKYNMQMNESWQYTLYEGLYTIADENLGNGYKRYEVRIPYEYVSTPNYYNIYFRTRDPEVQDDFNINFVLLNNTNTDNGIGEIITPSGDIISGEAIKDNTTLGDINNTIGEIQNTITEEYDPNKNILNNMTSGEILENMGYNTTEDPNADLWDTIINGLKETLTGNGNVELELPLRSKTITINSEEIKQPENELKFFTGLFVNFWLLMQMFTFIKKTIDQINEGNLKVMHDVDADCYFF